VLHARCSRRAVFELPFLLGASPARHIHTQNAIHLFRSIAVGDNTASFEEELFRAIASTLGFATRAQSTSVKGGGRGGEEGLINSQRGVPIAPILTLRQHVPQVHAQSLPWNEGRKSRVIANSMGLDGLSGCLPLCWNIVRAQRAQVD